MSAVVKWKLDIKHALCLIALHGAFILVREDLMHADAGGCEANTGTDAVHRTRGHRHQQTGYQ